MKTKVNWAILGTGKIAEKFAEALQYVDNAQLYAVGSRQEHTAISFAQKFSIEKAYGSYEKMLADSEIDVVYIASPHVMHYKHTIMCLKSGKAVLCEKPFAMNAEQVDKMIEEAQKQNLFLMEALWTRFLPTINKIEELISKNVIGDIIQIQSDFGIKAVYDPQWRLFNKQLGGGALLDIGIYPVFISLFLLGEPDEIVSSSCIGKTGVDESMSVIFKYNQGKMASLNATFMANTPTETHICGTEARIKIHRMWHIPSFLTLTMNDGTSEDIKFNYRSNGYEYEAQEVTNCILAGEKQSSKMPLTFSQKLIRLLDKIRKQWGLEY